MKPLAEVGAGLLEYSYIDQGVRPGHTYNYWLQEVDFYGNTEDLDSEEVTIPRVKKIPRNQ